MNWTGIISWSGALLSYLVTTSVGHTLLVAIFAILLIAFRRRIASERHFIGVCFLMGLFVVAAFPLVFGKLELPILPRAQIATEELLPEQLLSAPATKTEQTAPLAFPVSPNTGLLTSKHVSRGATSTKTLSRAEAAMISAAGFHLILAGLLLTQLLAAILLIQRKRYKTDMVTDGSISKIFAELSKQICPKAKTTLVLSNAVKTPITLGLFRHLILLPASLVEQLDAEDIRRVLTHELAHVKRNDFVVNLLTQILKRVFFLNPLLWLFDRWLRFEREKACDDYVLSCIPDAQAYAHCLTSLLGKERLHRVSVIATPGVLGLTSQLRSRIVSILEGGRNMSVKVSKLMKIVVPVVALLFAICFGGISLTRRGAKESVVLAQELRSKKEGGTAKKRGRETARERKLVEDIQTEPNSGTITSRPTTTNIAITYTVRPGDTLQQIAKKFGTTPVLINLGNQEPATNDRVRVGERLMVRMRASYQTVDRLVECKRNLKQLGAAFYVYAKDHEGKLPSAEKWTDELKLYIGKMLYDSLQCPETKGKVGYAMNASLSGVPLKSIAPNAVVLFETIKTGYNQADNGESLTKPGRHLNGGIVFLFGDGQVECRHGQPPSFNAKGAQKEGKQEEPGIPVRGVRLQIRAASPAFTIGEPVKIFFTLKNEGQHTFQTYSDVVLRRGGKRLTLQGGNWRVTAWWNIQQLRGTSISHDIRAILKPGAVYEGHLMLSDSFDLPEGIYTVQLALDMHTPPDEIEWVELTPDMLRESPDGVRYIDKPVHVRDGERFTLAQQPNFSVRSNAIKIEVRGPARSDATPDSSRRKIHTGADNQK